MIVFECGLTSAWKRRGLGTYADDPKRICPSKHRIGTLDRSCSRKCAFSAWSGALRSKASLWLHRRASLLSRSAPSGIVASCPRLRYSTRKVGIRYSPFCGRSARFLVPRFRCCTWIGADGSHNEPCAETGKTKGISGTTGFEERSMRTGNHFAVHAG
jgi:hypothetical protein